MDISVIVPIYGVEKFIEQSLRSLFSQTKREGVEYILVNDCTPDSSMEVARRVIAEFPELCVRIINKPQNEGLAAARQTGLEAAMGDYFITIDSDDWVESDLLEKIYSRALESDADITVADFWFSMPTKEERHTQNIVPDGTQILCQMLLMETYPSIWSKLIRRSFLLDHQLGWERGIDMGEDLLICSKMFTRTNKIAHICEPLIHYRYNPMSMTKNISLKSSYNLVKAIEIVEKQFEDAGELTEEVKAAIVYRKLNIKAELLMCSGISLIRKNSKVFPETAPYINDCDALPLRHKIAMKLANRGFVLIPSAIYLLISIFKKLAK